MLQSYNPPSAAHVGPPAAGISGYLDAFTFQCLSLELILVLLHPVALVRSSSVSSSAFNLDRRSWD